VDCAAITPAQIPDVLDQWRRPEHEEFASRNAFSLWDAFTEVFKGINPHTALRRGEALHGLFAAETGVAARVMIARTTPIEVASLREARRPQNRRHPMGSSEQPESDSLESCDGTWNFAVSPLSIARPPKRCLMMFGGRTATNLIACVRPINCVLTVGKGLHWRKILPSFRGKTPPSNPQNIFCGAVIPREVPLAVLKSCDNL